MKLSTLLEIIGSGSIMLLVGVALLMLGISYGISEGTHIPLWAALCGMGLFLGIVGIAFLDRGTEEAEEQVKALPMMNKALHNPWMIAGASVVGGLILQRIFRVHRDPAPAQPVVVVEQGHTAESLVEHKPTSTPAPARARSASSFSISKFIGDQLRSLGTKAASMAVTTAVNSLKIPSVDTLLKELVGGQKKPDTPAGSAAGHTNRMAQDNFGQGTSSTTGSSSRPSHNGYNHPAPFDAAT